MSTAKVKLTPAQERVKERAIVSFFQKSEQVEDLLYQFQGGALTIEQAAEKIERLHACAIAENFTS